MLTLEYIAEQKAKYQELVEYYKKLGFNVLEAKFTDVIDLIEDMEKYVEEHNGKVTSCG